MLAWLPALAMKLILKQHRALQQGSVCWGLSPPRKVRGTGHFPHTPCGEGGGGAGEGVVSPTPAPALKPPLGVSSVPGGFLGDRRARRPSCSSGVRADFPLGKWLLPEKRPDARAAPGGRGPRLPPAGGSGQGPGWPLVLLVPPGPG